LLFIPARHSSGIKVIKKRRCNVSTKKDDLSMRKDLREQKKVRRSKLKKNITNKNKMTYRKGKFQED
jgi:hypothetical protein